MRYEDPMAVILATALGLGVLVGAGVGNEMATLQGDVDVVGVACDDGNVTALELAIEIDEDQPVGITPHVWDAQQHVQHPWEPKLIILESGSHTIEISAPSVRAEMKGSPGQVYLADGQGRLIENFEVSCSG